MPWRALAAIQATATVRSAYPCASCDTNLILILCIDFLSPSVYSHLCNLTALTSYTMFFWYISFSGIRAKMEHRDLSREVLLGLSREPCPLMLVLPREIDINYFYSITRNLVKEKGINTRKTK